MTWEFEFYQKPNGRIPVLEFLDALPAREAAKVIRTLQIIEANWPDLGLPYMKHLEGYPLFEARTQVGNRRFRVFFFPGEGQKLLAVHAFTKKSDRTPPGEIEVALSLKKEYESRVGGKQDAVKGLRRKET